MPAALAAVPPVDPAPPPPTVAAASAAVRGWLAAAAAVFLQRAGALRCLVLADVCPVPTNVLYTGEPGTAKTALIGAYSVAASHRLCLRTLSPWTEESALLGGIDIAALAAGDLRRVSGRGVYLPDATLIGLDELPRAGKGIRELCLAPLDGRLLPDRVTPVPAHVIVATANTRLVDEDDRALVDRFALRCTVGRVTGPDLGRVIGRSVPIDGVAPASVTLPAFPPGAVDVLRAHAASVSFPAAVLAAVETCAHTLRKPAPADQRHPDVSERRWIIATRLLQASAAIAGRDVVTFDDVVDTLPFVIDDGDDAAAAVRNAIASSIPAYVSALRDVRRACDDAVSLARRIEVDADKVSAETAAKHNARETTLRALAASMSQHGEDCRKQATALVAAALDACDDAVAEGVQARRARR